MPSIARTLDQIRTQLGAMRTLAQTAEADLHRAVPRVSAWCRAQHLDHLARVSTSIFRKLAAPAPLDRGMTLLGRLILTVGWIPRGRGKSPERLHGARVDTTALLASVAECEELMTQLDPAALAKSNAPLVPHPKFGGLTAAQALRFVAIHNAHHMKIIEDIGRK